MTNFEVYKKTLSFSFIGFLVDLLSLIIFFGLCVAGFFIFNKSTDMALLGLLIGALVSIPFLVLISIFISNRIKAAQISMMTYGVVDGKLPDNTFKAGFAEIKGRFGKITTFFLITHLIKSVFNQLSRAINRVGTAIGGDAGNAITSTIDAAVQILIGYLCDCCLGWVLYRKDVNGFKAGCEGAVIFFKHGKTLIRNIGRIFGMGALSLVVIGGAFFGITYLISNQFPQFFDTFAAEITEFVTRNNFENFPAALQDPKILILVFSGVIGVVIWGIIHSVLIRPFILVGVLRNFMAAGIADIPTEEQFAELEKLSPRFTKMRNKANA